MKKSDSVNHKHHHDTLVPFQTGGHKHESHMYGRHAANHTKHKEHIVKHFKDK